MLDLKIKYNELTAEQFIELWETVWGDGPSLEQTRLAMKHTLFRVSIWDGDCIVAMARMNGDSLPFSFRIHLYLPYLN